MVYASATKMGDEQKRQVFRREYDEGRERTFFVLHLLDISTGSEHLVTAGDDNSPHTVICLGLLKLGIEGIEQRCAQCIQGLWPVKGQDGYVVGRRTRGNDELFCRAGHGADGESVRGLGRPEKSAD